ncbi:MAG: VOC family protein [Opitutaceae bacterium]
MPSIQKITPCLWFDTEAEDAARFYIKIFKNAKIGEISRYGEAGKEFHGREPGSVLTVAFELDGHAFTALNGGPQFKFSEAISFQINCDTQDEVDHFWTKLSEGGPKEAQQCGWLKDKFGVSWQVVPKILIELLNDPDTTKSQRTMTAMLQMKKLDIAGLKRAHAGQAVRTAGAKGRRSRKQPHATSTV